MMPLWTIVSDDLTGLQAIAGEFARLGFRVGTGISQLPTHAELEQFEVYAFDTATRPLGPSEAEARVADAVQHLMSIGVRRIFKHNDSILQGHVGLELRAVASVTGARPIVYVPACPNRLRVTQAGIQLELDERGGIVAGGLRQDLRECISHGTGLTTRVMEEATLHAGGAAALIAAADCDVLIADATTDEDLDLIVLAAQQAGCRVLSGSVGLAAALARAAVPQRGFAQPVVVVAGSLQVATQCQVARLLARPDCADVRLEPNTGESSAVIVESVQRIRCVLSLGLNCVVWTPREALTDTDRSVYPVLSHSALAKLRRDLGAVLHGVIADAGVPIGGLVAVGGTTADLTLRDVLGVTRFTGLRWLCEGMTMAIAVDGARPGLAVVTKSGGWGPPGALCDAIDWLGSCRYTQPTEPFLQTIFPFEGVSQ